MYKVNLWKLAYFRLRFHQKFWIGSDLDVYSKLFLYWNEQLITHATKASKTFSKIHSSQYQEIQPYTTVIQIKFKTATVEIGNQNILSKDDSVFIDTDPKYNATPQWYILKQKHSNTSLTLIIVRNLESKIWIPKTITIGTYKVIYIDCYSIKLPCLPAKNIRTKDGIMHTKPFMAITT